MNLEVDGLYPRVSLGFANKSNTVLIAFVRNVLAMMNKNTDYPTPAPTLAAVTTSVNAFEQAAQEAMDGGKVAIATRNAARRELLALMRQLAAYVQNACNGDLVILLSSGFSPVRARSPKEPLAPPANQRMEYNGMSGELILRYDRVRNARNFSVQKASSADGPWEDVGLFTVTRVTITGLTPGKVCWARARANGTAGPSEWGGPAWAMVI